MASTQPQSASDSTVHPVSETVRQAAHVNRDRYDEFYRRSIDDPEGFWGEQAGRLNWMRAPKTVKTTSFARSAVDIKWFEDGTLNVAANCLDRHLSERGDQPAIIWEGDSPDDDAVVTYAELHDSVCRFANALKRAGAKKGDVVTLYMPMIPQAAVAMLACARIGAIHSVVFGGFSAEALAGRIIDGGSRFVVTADEGVRGGRKIPLKTTVDAALDHDGIPDIAAVFVVRHTGADVAMVQDRDRFYDAAIEAESADCPPEELDAEDPLFILYTSGSTGTPKGVLHSSGGYLLYAGFTFETIFDYKPGEVFWCTADVGWITGHSYLLYGPLSVGAVTLMHEGLPNYPTSARLGQVIDKHGVNILYTAPTLIRSLMRDGEPPVRESSRETLRIMGSVGEPINPEAWNWYHRVVGDGRCPIVDTYWQTETGGVLMTPLPGATPLKPGAASWPFFGVQPALVDNDGKILEGAAEGNLVMLDSWPGQARTVYGDHERFMQTYFATFDNKYFTGDGARRDEDGYYWITGRVDDVLNVSGHRMGTAEIESALVAHPAVAEAAVVGFPHDLKGQGIYCYVTLTEDAHESEDLRQELRKWVRHEIGPVASPDVVQFAEGLPKTRSGKIMRRILRKIAAKEFGGLGDTSTLADPNVVEDLISTRKVLG